MSRFIDFGSIGQFRSIVKYINSKYQKPIDPIVVIGTEKIHGTNASICYSKDGFWVQSRKNIITKEKDNSDCASIAYQYEDEWTSIVMDLVSEYEIDLEKEIVSIFFEWCGGNIQKKSCVSGMEKKAIIFNHFKVSPIEKEIDDNGDETGFRWIETKIGEKFVENPESNIYNVRNFPTVKLEIDFSELHTAIDKMSVLVDKVETNSGISNFFNKPENIGEGWVWTFIDKYGDLQRFKTKGDKHSKSNVKKLESVDIETEQAKIDFSNYATPAWRLEQAWQTVFGIENDIMEPSMKGIGKFLSAVMADVYKEEKDILEEKGLTQKQVNPLIAQISKNWFIKEFNQNLNMVN